MDEYKCDICGAPATVHLTQIVDGKIHKAHLCANCAAKSKVAELPIMKFTEMLAKTLASGGKKASEEAAATDAAGREPAKICPACGMTDVVFEKKQLFGCARCYDVFAEEIAALLPKIQRGRDYRGDAAKKNPAGKSGVPATTPVPAAEKSSAAALGELRERLKSAAAREDYALAARLRDELRAAEKAAAASATTVPAKRVPAAKKSSAKKRVPAAKGEKSVPAKPSAEKKAPARSRAASKPADSSAAGKGRGKKSSGGKGA